MIMVRGRQGVATGLYTTGRPLLGVLVGTEQQLAVLVDVPELNVGVFPFTVYLEGAISRRGVSCTVYPVLGAYEGTGDVNQ